MAKTLLANRFTSIRNAGLGLLLALGGCASSALTRQEQVCPLCERTEIAVTSPLSPLTAFTMTGTAHPRLHVYLEGDGQPWSRWNMPSADPNSRGLTALKLMQMDGHNRVYLNRPCYGSDSMPAHCHAGLWTAERYSEAVISAMDQALDQLSLTHQAQELVLIGHSGGGSIALLLASRRNDVAAVVTLAANLDHKAWTDWFDYLPLATSLNAVDVTLPDHVLRWHLIGGQDAQVPADTTMAAARRDPLARVELLPHFDHSCCWGELWPGLLERLAAQLNITR